MYVYKFGGGVLKDAQSLEKLPEIIGNNDSNLLIVVSAFGKTTEAFESLLSSYYFSGGFQPELLEKIQANHYALINDLGLSDDTALMQTVCGLFRELKTMFQEKISSDKYFEYDRIVPYGELLSANIVTAFLNKRGIPACFADARNYLITDSGFGDAKILWNETEKKIQKEILFSKSKITVSQGFTGSNLMQRTTTLGREGSDYTAAVYAYCLDASEVVFWKNVPGVFNADPNLYEDAQLLAKLSYKEAVEQTFYGAKILHPKTIKPLQNKKIPLRVRPFSDISFEGTQISEIAPTETDYYPKIPIFIKKNDQILFSVSALDFSFVAENSLSKIFALLAKYRLKVSVMQNSAISFSFCVGNVKETIPLFAQELKRDFHVRYNDGLSLITIRHYTEEAIKQRLEGKEVLLRQISRYTARFVVRNGSEASVFRYDFISQNISDFEN